MVRSNGSRRTWLVDTKVIAKKVKHAGKYSTYQHIDWGSGLTRECPNCKHHIDNSDVAVEWPGLPAGVKFDPSDLELLEHLEGKIGLEKSKLHPLIDEFIPTVEEDEGICYTHPENLPGVKKDGSSAHFFHRTSNAYSTGHRKRRKIQKGHTTFQERVRWHKTGKTRQIEENGIQKGCKKIMVLYKSSKKSKPNKTNWVMHQYHLGIEEDEKNGEFVVSKIFYQQGSTQADRNDLETELLGGTGRSPRSVIAEPEQCNRVGPRTPMTTAPDLLRLKTFDPIDEVYEDNSELPSQQVTGFGINLKISSNNLHEPVTHWLAGESQAAEDPDNINIDSSLLCDEVLDSFFNIGEGRKHSIYPDSDSFMNNICERGSDISSGIPDLDNIGLDTPPDFSLSDLQFCSQESLQNLLDRL